MSGAYRVCIVSKNLEDAVNIEKSLDWESLALKVVGVAVDGNEGEKLIRNCFPDILITDIELSGIDAFEMIKHSPVSKVIFISDDTDFANVKNAMLINAANFIEKKNFKDELFSTLENIVEELKEEEEDKGKKPSVDELIPIPHEANNRLVSAAIEFVENNYNKNIGLGDAAEYVHTTLNHLSTLFRESTGMNFLYYLNAYRINEADKLLKYSHLKVGKIAVLIGFSSSSYFTKIFKKYTGIKPSLYRNTH